MIRVQQHRRRQQEEDLLLVLVYLGVLCPGGTPVWCWTCSGSLRGEETGLTRGESSLSKICSRKGGSRATHRPLER